jgi:hypothetical protein
MRSPGKIRFMKQRRFIPVTDFSGIQLKAISGDPQAIDTVLSSAGAGNPLMVEVGALGMMGLATNTAGDDVRHLMAIPGDWDRSKPIGVRLLWASEAAAVELRTVDWKVLVRNMTIDSALAAPSQALGTPIATGQAPAGTAKTLQWTAWGEMAAGFLTDANELLAFLCEMDAKHAAMVETLYLLGIQFEYTPKHGVAHQEGTAPAWTA